MSPENTHAFRDPDLPLDARIDDLLGRLTPDEKLALLGRHQPAVPRLGIEPFTTGNDAPRGAVDPEPVTVFPQPVGLGSTWDPALVERVGAAVGDELRGLRAGSRRSTGLNVWAPVANPLRDPRWGRNAQGYAEDPLLTAEMAAAYARGLRGDHPRVLRTAPAVGHFLARNNETDRLTTSANLPPRVLHEYELPAYRAAVADGAAVGVVLSPNLVNGRPAHLSPLVEEVLRRWAPHELLVFGEVGAVGDIAEAQDYHPDRPSAHAAALRAGLDSFTDRDADPTSAPEHLRSALERSLITWTEVDRAVRRVLSLRFRLGEFDPPERDPYARTTAAVVGCPAHRELAREAARASVVLLRNERDLLPLSPRLRRVAVVGPLADTVPTDRCSDAPHHAVTPVEGLRRALGPGARVETHDGADRIALRVAGSHRYVTAAEGDGGPLRLVEAEEPAPATLLALSDWGQGTRTLRSLANGRLLSTATGGEGTVANDRSRPTGPVAHETFTLEEQEDGSHLLRSAATGGYLRVRPDGALAADAPAPSGALRLVVELVEDGVAAAAALAATAEVAVVVVGDHPTVGGAEPPDRVDLRLAPGQEELVRAVLAANPATALVVESGHPAAITWADRHVPAALWLAHGGQETGNALADVLLGRYSPAGRLPQTWYRSATDLPDPFDYDVVTSDATYLYFRGTPLYPFGHGLTYTSFDYHDLRLSADEVDADGEVTVSVAVTNTGRRAGDEVVQLYTHQQKSRVKQPVRQLRGFRRIHLAPGATARVEFRLRARALSFWDVTTGRRVVEAARHRVMVGRSCAAIRQCATLVVHGERIGPRDLVSAPVRAVDFDDHSGVQLVDEFPTTGDAVASTKPGDWISFEEVDLATGVGGLTALVARAGEPDGNEEAVEVELRLDDPIHGPLVGSVPVRPTGGPHRWARLCTAVRGADGVHDLYLVFTGGGIRLAALRLDRV